MTRPLAFPFVHALARVLPRVLPRVGRVFAARPQADDDRQAVADALASAGAWYFEVDAERRIREVFPVPPAVRTALLGHDIRSFIDPLDPMSEHPRLARAFRGRAAFRDVVMPFDRGQGSRRLRVSGDPMFDARGAFCGYRGLAVDAARAMLLPAPAIAMVDATPAAHPGAAPCGRVLVVHATPALGDLLSVAFERAGFESAVCRDGLEAVEILTEDATAWDVLVTTGETPTLDGAALLRRAKALRPALLGVVCDATDGAGAAEGAADVAWQRPADVVALTQRVRAELVLRRPLLPHPAG